VRDRMYADECGSAPIAAHGNRSWCHFSGERDSRAAREVIAAGMADVDEPGTSEVTAVEDEGSSERIGVLRRAATSAGFWEPTTRRLHRHRVTVAY